MILPRENIGKYRDISKPPTKRPKKMIKNGSRL
jgi:hypothetical protein